MPPSINLEDDVVHKAIDLCLIDFSIPTYIFEEDDIINGAPSQEVIVETLHHEMMVMSSYQPMTSMLCQVVPYPSLEDNDKHKVREISLTTEDTRYPIIEYVMDDVSLSDENNNKVVEVLTEWYTEKISKDLGTMQSVEIINEDSFME